jgi:L-alanine-DL-glutamate epimerase-like enolase superfamily enzyme
MEASMRIRGVTTRPVVVPLSRPIVTASGTIAEAPLLLIDLETEEGVTGRAYLFGYQPFTLGPLGALVQAMVDMVRGDAVAPFELDRKLRARFTLLGTRSLPGMALSGVDMAAWDALARAASVPLVRLLGARRGPSSRIWETASGFSRSPRSAGRGPGWPTRASGRSRSGSGGHRSPRTSPPCAPRAGVCPTRCA